MEELKLIIDALEVFWYGDPNLSVHKGFVQALGMGINILAQVGAGFAAKKRMKEFEGQASDLEDKLSDLEANRQDIIDPSAGAKTFNFQNPYNNLTVATGAAEFAAEEADISLANTLDTLRATGASAGGATALAQAALRSKAGISASIQQQEAANTRMRAQGTMQMQGMQAQDQARVQALRARGQEFMFGAREMREVSQLDRTSAQLQNTQQRAANERSAMRSAFMGAAGSLGAGIAGGAFGSGKANQAANVASGATTGASNVNASTYVPGVTSANLPSSVYGDASGTLQFGQIPTFNSMNFGAALSSSNEPYSGFFGEESQFMQGIQSQANEYNAEQFGLAKDSVQGGTGAGYLFGQGGRLQRRKARKGN